MIEVLTIYEYSKYFKKHKLEVKGNNIFIDNDLFSVKCSNCLIDLYDKDQKILHIIEDISDIVLCKSCIEKLCFKLKE